MDEYISREDAINFFENMTWYHVNGRGQLVDGANSDTGLYKAKDVYKGLHDIPAADVAPVYMDIKPYTEPDLEQVRKEGYEEGKKQAKVQAELDVCHDIEKVAKENYKAGLSDAWEAVRKIYDLSQEDRLEIFPEASTFVVADICDRYSASECVEKIRQYEQEQEEFHVGDEVELKCGVRPAIYMQGTKGSDEIYLLFNDGSCGLHSKSEIERKTGRRFPEIAAVFDKMRSNT